jgi:hypothetical protein
MGLIILIILPLISLFITGPAAASIFIVLLKRDYRLIQPFFWLALVAATFALGIFTAYTFSSFFPGPGCFITLFTVPAAIVTLLTFRFRAKGFYQAIGDEQRRRRWFQAATLAVPLLQLSVPAIALGYAAQCSLQNQQAARPIIAALETYKNETGHYPTLSSPYRSDLQFLVPRYLPAIPARPCTLPFEVPALSIEHEDWSVYFCSNSPGQETLLLVPIIGTATKQTYNLKTGQWWLGDAFEGYCP